MSYFLYDGYLEVGKSACLSGEEAQHLLHARRVKSGEFFELQDLAKNHFLVVLERISRQKLFFKVEKQLSVLESSPLQLELIVGLPKEKALDWIIQKATELGVTVLYFFMARYTAKSIPASRQEKALLRWQKIAQAACKQSGRSLPPEIVLFNNLGQALESLASSPAQWVLTTEPGFYSSPATLISEFASSKIQRFIVGPEGGLHAEELELAYQHGMRSMSLGPRILRTETAAIAMIVILQFLFGDLSQIKNIHSNI
ncbi:MAG: 16S rRNA (uracil(1498)-N(3))-methyltransferase [SAR324 cluster bacterium]|nr:16S rRNA (uracil(1498)-N(3))-methyltransferase [SAR324 cluster bacterium]